MCQKILELYINNKKLDWLERKLPNPYASGHDKVDFYLLLMFVTPFVLILSFGKTIPCVELSMELGFIAMFLWFIRHIKTVPADISQPILKPIMCYEMFFMKIVIIFGTFSLIGNCTT